MIRNALITLLLGLVAVSAQAHDDRLRTAVGAGLGAAVGSAIGSELGGRNEAILGGAIGGAVGAAIATRDRHDRDRHDRDRHYRSADRYHYREDRRYDSWKGGRRHERRHHGASFCPPGLAMQGRC